MRPFLERMAPTDGASWAMLNRRLDDSIPFQWHHHPEYELTLTLNSRGHRFIGDHIGEYDDGDLVLIGPNLPHSWSSAAKREQTQPHIALVMWFRQDWAGSLYNNFNELEHIQPMLARAAAGLHFSNEAAQQARPFIEALFAESPAQRLLSLIRVLSVLAADDAATTLSHTGILPQSPGTDRSRIDRVLDHIHQNYSSGLSVETLAGIAALSPSGLHRLFRRHLHTTITDYVMRLKIGEACAMLAGSDKPVSHIADAVGYDTLANFNRQFKALRGMTPRTYRQASPLHRSA